MELKEAVNLRKSVRGYLDKPVEKAVIEEVLELASRAVSAHNAQPWEVCVVTGEPLEKLKEANLKRLYDGSDQDRLDTPVPEEFNGRGRELGIELFRLMDIKREDREKRRAWSERGYRFFDAPVAVFLLMDEVFDESAFRFDMGCFTQNLCLAAQELGLGTCVANQIVTFNREAREILGIPSTKRFVCGIALGYEDPDFPANEIKSKRVPVEEFSSWAGFDK